MAKDEIDKRKKQEEADRNLLNDLSEQLRAKAHLLQIYCNEENDLENLFLNNIKRHIAKVDRDNFDKELTYDQSYDAVISSCKAMIRERS